MPSAEKVRRWSLPPTSERTAVTELRAIEAAALGGEYRRRTPPAFIAYTLALTVVAAAAAIGAWLRWGWPSDADDARLVLFAALVVVGELLPIEVPRRYTPDRMTISTAFAFAILLEFGPLPAIVVYAFASAVADVVGRSSPATVLFNVAQYVLSVAAAAVSLMLVAGTVPVADIGDQLPGVLVAAAVLFVVNHGLAGVGAAMLTHDRLPAYLRRNVGFQVWTAGFLLAMAPLLVVASQVSLALAAVSFLPMLAIYFGGRQAALNSYRAVHDELTGLPNRWFLQERLDQALADRKVGAARVGVMIIDLDDFKAINDTLGHYYGDEVLKELAPRLRAGLREQDTLARLGGDEFAVILDDVAAVPDAIAVAERMLALLAEPVVLDSLSLDLRASVGVAFYPEHADSARSLIQYADVALYRAKESGSSAAVFDPDLDDYGLDRVALAAQLRRSIANDQLVVDYQPKIRLNREEGHGAEALVRWRHPQLGLIEPDAFIPLAEHSGLIKPLTMSVIDKALGQFRSWQRSGPALRVSVNLSSRCLVDPGLPAEIAGLLEKHSVAPRWLQLEVTESRIVANLPRAKTMLRQLRGLGVGLAIDDFGTGFSSLGQLQELPFEEIKIDKSFVIDMLEDESKLAIVKSTIGLGRALGLEVTAEGVEDASLYQRLSELGCDFVQGFHLGRPAGADRCRDHVVRYLADCRRRGLKVVGHDHRPGAARGDGLAADDSNP
jgi:diguanylate cyclase (GGDEF)-like protein